MMNRGQAGRARDIDVFLSDFVGHAVLVHTSSPTAGPTPHNAAVPAGTFPGVLEAILSEAIVIHSKSEQTLIYKWAIVAIELPKTAQQDKGEV
jgi:hypothetical protein